MDQSRNQIQSPHRLVSVLILSGLLISTASCRGQSSDTAPAEPADVGVTECLDNLNLQRLDAALDRCNAVVLAYRSNPAPLVDRSLIFNLMNRPDEACRDVSKAVNLLKQSKQKPDAMIVHELTVRQQSCKLRATIAGKD